MAPGRLRPTAPLEKSAKLGRAIRATLEPDVLNWIFPLDPAYVGA